MRWRGLSKVTHPPSECVPSYHGIANVCSVNAFSSVSSVTRNRRGI